MVESQSPDNKNILAMIPAFNEASRITPVIKRTSHYLPVLVVDDGSSDDTAPAAVRRRSGRVSGP